MDQREILTALINGTATATGDEFFAELVKVLAETLGTRYSFVSELADPEGEIIRLISVWDGDGHVEPVEYASKATPCEQVIKSGIQRYPENVQHLFPDDEVLTEMCVESYLAIVLHDSSGSVIGHLGVMDVKPMAESDTAISVLRVLAGRASAELARVKSDRQIRELNNELERRVEERTAELLASNQRLQREIAERKLIESALGAREKQLRLISDSVPVLISYVDQRRYFRFVNGHYERLLGLDRDDIVGRPVREIVGNGTYEVIGPQMDAALDGHGGMYENQVVDPDGVRRTYRAHYVPHFDESGKVIGYFIWAEDVSEEFEAKEMLQRLREELAHALRTKTLGELTAAIAHELNQPLASIRTNAQAAQRIVDNGVDDWEEISEILDDIVADDQRAAEVITRLRALLTRGEVEHQYLDLNSVVNQVIKLVHHDAVMRQVTLTAELGDGLPPVSGDPIQLQQVLLNLIMNGFEAMSEIPEERRLLLVRTTKDAESGVAVTVTDSGPGFGELDLSTIFEPFETTKRDGLGMGLAISRSIIEAQHGRIEAIPGNGRGATIRFVLPAAESKTEEVSIVDLGVAG